MQRQATVESRPAGYNNWGEHHHRSLVFAVCIGFVAVLLAILLINAYQVMLVAFLVIFGVAIIAGLAFVALWLHRLWLSNIHHAAQLSVLHPDDNGNYPAPYYHDTGRYHSLPSGNAGVVPSHLHWNTKVSEDQDEQRVIEAPKVEAVQPDLRTIIQELPQNGLEFAFGTDTQTGNLIKTTLPKAIHIQLLGASGQGKSRQATSILTQLCAKNDPEHVQLALIDHEGETSVPFQHLPHTKWHADDARRGSEVLQMLRKELERRDRLHQAQPVILIFVEEFLNLRRQMVGNAKERALDDYTSLALRGRKRGMFLFAIGQTAYTDIAIRDAQAQFLSSMAFAVKPTAARAAGFTNTPLINRVYSERKPAQFLLERSQGDVIALAPFVDSTVVSESLFSGSQPLPDHFPYGSEFVSQWQNEEWFQAGGKQTEPHTGEISSQLDTRILQIVRSMIAEHKSQNEITQAAFAGMRASDALVEYRKYLAALIVG